MESSVWTWLTPLLSAAASVAVTTIVGFIIKRYLDKYLSKKDKENEELREYREEKQRKERRADFDEALTPIKADIKDIKEDMKLNNNASLCTLRNDILTCYYRCAEKGYRTDNDYTNLHDMFEAYQGLHGNTFVADVVSRFDKLPTKEEYESTHKKTTKKKVTLNENK